MRPRVRIVDLYCGCGGLTLGVAEAARRLKLGIEVRLAVDTDENAVKVFSANLPEALVKLTKVEELFDGKLGARPTPKEKLLKRQIGEIDVLVGGPPCQGHSDLNNHTRRDDPRNALYARMARAAEVMQPRIVLIENVPSVTHDVENVVDETIRALKAADYSVTEAVINTARLGAPQSRRRHVVLAAHGSAAWIAELLATVPQRCRVHPNRSVKWAIQDLKKRPVDDLFNSASTPNATNVGRIAWLFQNRRYELPNRRRPECHQSGHTYNSMYGRLRWNKPAQTVTTGFGSMGQGRYVHPAQRRTLTAHEAARLQSLPDFWRFDEITTRGGLARLIGNAVPPVLAAALLEPALRFIGLGIVSSSGKKTQTSSIGATVSRRRKIVRRRSATTPESSSAEASTRMKSIRQRDTEPEIALRAAIRKSGLRFLVNCRLEGLRGRVDIAFPQHRLAVYVDGCFWHGCPLHATKPKANRHWWSEKLAHNKRRDAATNSLLRSKGWTVLRFWEHMAPSECLAQIASVIALLKTEQAIRSNADTHF